MSSIISKIRFFLFGTTASKWISIFIGSSLLFVFYLSISRIVVYNSDNASIILEAQAMARGNVVLRGWYVPTDSFLTIEVPFYALGLLLGFSPSSLLHVIPALLYTLLVVLASYLASTLSEGKQRVWSALAFLGIVAFPDLNMTQRLLVGPLHIGTIVLILVGLISYRYFLIDKSNKTAFAVIILVVVLTVVGDPFTLVLFVLPLMLTEGIQMFVKKQVSLREDVVILGILLAGLLAFGIRMLTDLVGVHNLVTAGFLLTSISGMVNNFISAIKGLGTIFHADIFTIRSFSLSDATPVFNAFVVLSLIYASVRWSIRFLFHSPTAAMKIICVLIWSSIGVLSAFTLSTLGGDSGERYLYPLLFFGGLIGFSAMFPFLKRNVLIGATILVFLMNASLFTVSLYQAPAAVAPEQPLMTLLEEHHLTQGLGTYWISAIVTVKSEERVVLRQISITNRQIHPDYFLADEKWFDAVNLQKANFIVYREKDGPQIYYEASMRSFGVPDHQYDIGVYTVLAWNAPLLTHMQPGYSF